MIYVGGMFRTKGGHIVGPLIYHDHHIWKFKYQDPKGTWHFWTKAGYHELEMPETNIPDMDIVGPAHEEINYEEIVG